MPKKPLATYNDITLKNRNYLLKRVLTFIITRACQRLYMCIRSLLLLSLAVFLALYFCTLLPKKKLVKKTYQDRSFKTPFVIGGGILSVLFNSDDREGQHVYSYNNRLLIKVVRGRAPPADRTIYVNKNIFMTNRLGWVLLCKTQKSLAILFERARI